MIGTGSERRRAGGKAMLWLFALAVLMRLLVPAGWMPATDRGFAITLCTGDGATQAWIDERGNVQKGKPAGQQMSHDCLFSGFSAALDLTSPAGTPAAMLDIFGPMPHLARVVVAIGRGLAAPPPPATGPPSSL